MSALFEPGMIGAMRVKNRFVRSATAELLASDDGRVTDRYLKVYARLARGGVGLIITGNFYVNALGRDLPRIIVPDRDENIGDLEKVVEAVQGNGAKIVAQLNHCGRQANPQVIGTTPVCPSPVRDKFSRVKPREMTTGEIEGTIDAFGEAARRVKQAGFDGVQIHAAHGYLINQFLSGYTNRRKDRWGGSIENRTRFLMEVYARIRSEVGPGYPVLTKLNAEDFVPRGVTLEEATSVCRKLEENGIDAIEVSGGIKEKGLAITKGDIPRDLILKDLSLVERVLLRFMEKPMQESARFEEAYFLPYAAAIKRSVSIPILAVGGMRRRAVMENALKSGGADFISLCRPFIRQPNLVNRMEKDNGDPISCTSCNRCTLEMVVHHKPMKCYASGAPK